jgi:hypothetical protein
MRHLSPDADRIRREFLEGPATYGRLFALFHAHHAQRQGKTRWGDKSLHTERYAPDVFAEFPDARIIHMIRDPRDRFASVRKRYNGAHRQVGASTGRWLGSTRAGLRHERKYPRNYMLVRYEDLARSPQLTMERVCRFVGLDVVPEMFAMGGAPDHRDGGGNSSFGDLEPGAISTKAIGRFRDVLTPAETSYIQLLTGRELRALGYSEVDVQFASGEKLRYLVGDLPMQFARMTAAESLAAVERRRGEPIPDRQRGPVVTR